MAVAEVAAAAAVADAVAGAERTEEDVVMNALIRRGCITLAAGLLACLAQAAGAQEEPLVSKLSPAWNRLALSNAKFLTKEQQVLLDDLAFAAAVAGGGCPDFQLDRKKFEDAFAGFKTDAYMKLAPEEKRRLEYRLMANYGATVALYGAEGLLHPKEACRYAEGKRAEGPGRFWLPATTAAR